MPAYALAAWAPFLAWLDMVPSGQHCGPFSFPPFLLDHLQVGAVQGLTALYLSFLICKMGT